MTAYYDRLLIEELEDIIAALERIVGLYTPEPGDPKADGEWDDADYWEWGNSDDVYRYGVSKGNWQAARIAQQALDRITQDSDD